MRAQAAADWPPPTRRSSTAQPVTVNQERAGAIGGEPIAIQDETDDKSFVHN